MPYYDYKCSQQIAAQDYSFEALIMAAMRQADNKNLEALKAAFPQVYQELLDRYNAPGGRLGSERNEVFG
jgi:hypothetical protein